MGTREDLIAQIQAEEEAQAIQAELTKRKTTPTLGQQKLGQAQAVAEKLPDGIGGFAKESLKNLGVGALETANTALQGHPLLGPLLNFIGMKTSGKTPGKAVSDLPVEDMGLWGKVMRGTGGGLLGAPSAATLPVAGISGGMGALGGEVGGNTAENLGLPRAVGEIPGAVLGGGATALGLGPRQLPAQAEIRDATQGANWQKVYDNALDLEGSGAKTATAAEAFPQGSGVRDLANRVRGGTSSNALKVKMEDRAKDLSGLGDEFLRRIGPPVEANAVAERVAQAANALEQNLNKVKNQAFGNRLDGAAVRPDLVKQLEDALLQEAQREVRGGPKGAYRELAASLRNPDTGALITSTPELSKVLYGFQTQMKNGAILGKGGNSIAANDMAIPLKNAKEGLETFSPEFAGANADARAFNQGPRTDFAQSPLKKLADRNPNIIDPTPVGRLNAITDGTSENQIAQLLASLERDPGLLPGQGVGANEITRAMMQNKLKGAPTNPGAAVRGNPGSATEAQIAQMLTSGGRDPNRVMQPLRASDLMQDAATQGGLNSQPKIQPLQWLIRTLRSADMTVTGRGIEKMDQEIARLLADPKNLAEIQRIAQFDPAIRRQLMLMAPMLGGSVNQQGAQ